MEIRTVFIARDFGIPGIQSRLGRLERKPPEGHIIKIAGSNPNEQGEILRDYVDDHLKRADGILALLDRPNANVAFEVGCALGHPKPVAFLAIGSEPPAWLTQSLLKGYLIGCHTEIAELRKQVASGAWVPELAKPEPGDETLFLCPRHGEGGALREEIEEWDEHARILELDDWNLRDLPHKLKGVGRLVWVLAPHDGGAEEGDGTENSSHALIAGYARSIGLELCVWLHEGMRELADVSQKTEEFRDAQFIQLLNRLRSTTERSDDDDGLRKYYSWLAKQHAHPPGFFDMTERELLEVYVEMEIHDEPRRMQDGASYEPMEREWLGSAHSLPELMALKSRTDLAHRWVLLGDPGSGKSTACRHLCLEIARQALADTEEQGARSPDVNELRPIPIYLSLTRLVRAGGQPFELLAQDARRFLGDQALPAFLESIRDAARSPGRVWLLLDGLDEIESSERRHLSNMLRTWGETGDCVGCTLLVTSRSAGYEPLGKPFREVRLRALDDSRQKKLLGKWLGPVEGARAWERLNDRPSMLDLCRNPLMLSLVAKLLEKPEGEELTQDASVPPTRAKLFEDAVSMLLKRGHTAERKGVRDSIHARDLLASLSLRLQEGGGEQWSEQELHEAIKSLTDESDTLANCLRPWQFSNERFLQDVGENSGLIAAFEGAHLPWRYLHRSFKEFLAAVQLNKRSSQEQRELIGKLHDVPRWGETFALLCGQLSNSKSRVKLLEDLGQASPELALRTLPHVEELAPEEALRLLRAVKDPETERWQVKHEWDGDHLAGLVRGWRSVGHADQEIRELLLEAIGSPSTVEHEAFVLYALNRTGIAVDRNEFFEHCGRPVPGRDALPETVRIPPGHEDSIEFLMGSPKHQGEERERPQHWVTLSAYYIGRYPVTVAAYRRFAPEHIAHSEDSHPVVNVSWWEAWLYAQWIGGRLATEAEWECACRAGTQTRWSHGDDESGLSKVAWYDVNANSNTHPVGEKQPNAWGICDMHGHVWEWCQDWFADGYPGANHRVDPVGPDSGSSRVLRGGSFENGASGLRSTCRGWGRRGNGYRDQGFRIVLPAPRQ